MANVASEWQESALGDVITLQRGFDLPAQDRRSGKIPIVSSSGVSGTHVEAKVTGPGVVTGRYGTIGQVFYIKSQVTLKLIAGFLFPTALP